MLRKEILKCDKIVLHFKQAKKKQAGRLAFFSLLNKRLKHQSNANSILVLY